MSGGTASRRRGRELEDALLEAAWEELVAVGYGRFTIENVAARAGTSRPVIYRRWPGRPELALAAIRHYGSSNPVPVPDTGNLRDDLIGLFRQAGARRRELAVLFSVQMGEFFAETGQTPADLRDALLERRDHPLAIDDLLDRAVARGEIDPSRLTPRIARLPADLYRAELLMTLRPVPDESIAEIVDTIFLPLVTNTPQTSRTAP